MTATAISVICVFNDPAVRADCLDRSLTGAPAEVEYIPIDNTCSAFPTAGAALNHGARLANNPVVVFVHQDVYLHSVEALMEAATQLLEADLGIGGAVGIASDGTLVGRIRDRVVLTGEPVTGAADVDSLDEVLFLMKREQVLAEPLTESADLAWHGYAVEYGLRMRSLGRRVAALDIPLTHNSLTINLDRLDVAHRTLSRQYRALAPVQTTCGPIRDALPVDRPRALKVARGWARQLLDLATIVAGTGMAAPAIARVDLRLNFDDIVVRGSSPTVVNVLRTGHFVGNDNPVTLVRRGRTVRFHSANLRDACRLVADSGAGQVVVLTDLAAADFRDVQRRLGQAQQSGYHPSTRYWMLFEST